MRKLLDIVLYKTIIKKRGAKMNNSGHNIAHLISNLRGGINEFILARLADEGISNLAPSHGAIFVVLYNEGPQTMLSLSEKINRDKSTLTVLVRKLEALGYVERESDEADKRVSIISLTEKGQRFRAVFEEISKELVEKIWGGTPDKERCEITEELKRMLERL
ncbi:MarR family transcriptional regulator [Deltaproteobacteria bacterium Smac51]|nr:MarR family transcriptional regulator [Deltaproteobacteria bacterium Smac51]